MKIVFLSKDKKPLAVELRGTWAVLEGKHFDRLRAPDGAEHFFTKEGFYDGWAPASIDLERK